jgi:hypothetical protein
MIDERSIGTGKGASGFDVPISTLGQMITVPML